MVIELQHMVATSFWYRKSLCINKKLLSQAICPPYLHGLIPQCTHKIQGCDTPLQVFRSQVRYYNRIKRELVSIFPTYILELMEECKATLQRRKKSYYSRKRKLGDRYVANVN
ncbi:hypothetical protein D6D04_09459 [Aureobasidium pullulans]|nr:hypothetical protein D6D04_09459 [Aureobasidium pullulans]